MTSQCKVCKGRGWLLATLGTGTEERYLMVQRCDACKEYAGDGVATQAALQFLGEVLDREEAKQ